MPTATYADHLLNIDHAFNSRVRAGQAEGTVAAVYTTWFPGCFTAGSQGQPAAHTRYTVLMPAGPSDVPATMLAKA